MDDNLLLWINQGWASPAMDILMRWISQKREFALPLLLGLAGFLYWRYRLDGLKLWLLLLMTIGLSDSIGNALKHLLEIPRPCFDLFEQVRQPNNPQGGACGHGWGGMPSNHTFNYVTTATFLTLATRYRPLALLFFVVALLVGLSRIYLGMHYPSQVAVGALLGIGLGWLVVRLGLQYLPFMRKIGPSVNRLSAHNPSEYK